ncbi:MAG: DUF4232 domain-containing protein [Thermomicrobiales bacterium]
MPRSLLRWGSLFVATLALGTLILSPGGATSVRADETAANLICFVQTGHCIAGLFLQYWTDHGGLARNGYPLTDERVEVLEDGHPYTVQYFERVRLEYHPENRAPYNVLLGQFGRDIHPVDPPAPPQPEPASDTRYFATTGHNVSGPFLAYWNADGGLAQFGYPISEPLSQQLEDGNTYTVQYFERARFEEHPENQPPYNIELGQFGRDILNRDQTQLVAPCRAANLSGSVFWQGAAGSLAGGMFVYNNGAAPCALGGQPTVQLLDQNGDPLQVNTNTDGPSAPVATIGIARGQRARLPLRWSNGCGARTAAASVLVTLAGGGQVSAPILDPQGQPVSGGAPPCNGPGYPSNLSIGAFQITEPEEVAVNVVLAYYGAINAHDYQAAYDLLGQQLQATQPYDTFAAGYATTQHVQIFALGQAASGGDPYPVHVHVRLTARQTDGTVQHYHGVYNVGWENGALKLVGADIVSGE